MLVLTSFRYLSTPIVRPATFRRPRSIARQNITRLNYAGVGEGFIGLTVTNNAFCVRQKFAVSFW